jgi:hypothetical protein
MVWVSEEKPWRRDHNARSSSALATMQFGEACRPPAPPLPARLPEPDLSAEGNERGQSRNLPSLMPRRRASDASTSTWSPTKTRRPACFHSVTVFLDTACQSAKALCVTNVMVLPRGLLPGFEGLWLGTHHDRECPLMRRVVPGTRNGVGVQPVGRPSVTGIVQRKRPRPSKLPRPMSPLSPGHHWCSKSRHAAYNPRHTYARILVTVVTVVTALRLLTICVSPVFSINW